MVLDSLKEHIGNCGLSSDDDVVVSYEAEGECHAWHGIGSTDNIAVGVSIAPISGTHRICPVRRSCLEMGWLDRGHSKWCSDNSASPIGHRGILRTRDNG